MKTVHGIQIKWHKGLHLTSFESGLWHDSPDEDPSSWGFKIALVFGKILRPVARLWKLRWMGWANWPVIVRSAWPNPWSSGDHWFVLRIPFALGVFCSGSFGDPGFYIGTKQYEAYMEKVHYSLWMQPGELPTKPGVEYEYLAPSMSVRRTRLK